MKTIYIGSDHAGFVLKEKIKIWLVKHKIAYEDLGALTLNIHDDYPDYAAAVAKKVAKDRTLGILFCGSAQGVCITANKIKGIRAVVPFSLKEAILSREHTDANIICISGWYTPLSKATKMIQAFLKTPFSTAARHNRRVAKIKRLEQ